MCLTDRAPVTKVHAVDGVDDLFAEVDAGVDVLYTEHVDVSWEPSEVARRFGASGRDAGLVFLGPPASRRRRVAGWPAMAQTVGVEELLAPIGGPVPGELPEFLLSSNTSFSSAIVTALEARVLSALAGGATTAESATRLRVSTAAVTTATARLYEKLDVQSRAEAVARGIALGILGPSPTPPDGADAPVVPVRYLRPTVRAHDWRPGLPTIGVVHDHRLVAPALATALDGQAEVVSETIWGAGAAGLADLLNPDVIVVSEMLADGPTSMHLPALLRRGTRVLVLSEGTEVERLLPLLAAGAAAVCTFEEGLGAVAAAVMELTGGGSVLPAELLSTVLAEWRLARRGTVGSADLKLTARETDVLDAMVEGLSTKAIARRLQVAPKTVEHHKSRVFAKLGVSGQAEAIARFRTEPDQ